MSVHRVLFMGCDPVETILTNLKTDIADYDLSEMTNGAMGDIPSINGAHPLAMEEGEIIANGQDYTSPLPAIGVEQLDDTEAALRMLGGGAGTEVVDQADLTSWINMNYSDRLKNGIVASNTTLQAIQTALTAKGSEPLYANIQRGLFDMTINVSAWTEHWEVTNILYNVLKGLLSQQEYKGILKAARLQGQRGLYSFDYGRVLYGGEFSMSGQKGFKSWKVDTGILKIKTIEEHFPENRKMDPVHTTFGPLPVTIGE